MLTNEHLLLVETPFLKGEKVKRYVPSQCFSSKFNYNGYVLLACKFPGRILKLKPMPAVDKLNYSKAMACQYYTRYIEFHR